MCVSARVGSGAEREKGPRREFNKSVEGIFLGGNSTDGRSEDLWRSSRL